MGRLHSSAEVYGTAWGLLKMIPSPVLFINPSKSFLFNHRRESKVLSLPLDIQSLTGTRSALEGLLTVAVLCASSSES